MGFIWCNDEQRLRINLSKKAYLTMEEDMLLFHEKERSTFINRVFKNFRENATASVITYLEKKRQEFSRKLENIACDAETKKQIIKELVAQERQALQELLSQQEKNKSISKTYRINNENMEYLTSDECHEEEFYDTRIGFYLKCLMEEYAELPYHEREKIYFREFYDLAETAIQAHYMLKVTTETNLKYHVYPYQLIDDPISTRCYLAGYSVPVGATENKKNICSFRIPRLKSISLLKQSGRLTKTEVSALEQAIEVRSIQFLLGTEDEIRVRLTDTGIWKYNTQIHLRPMKDLDASTDHEYVFHCTPTQAEYYFFKFGEDAEILKPESLRKRFEELYRNASASYEK